MANTILGRAGIPVLEMLSTDQHASEIKHFLARFVNAITTNRQLAHVIPQRIETDFSWALIQAVLYAFNAEDCKAYLKRSWKIVHRGRKAQELKGKTYPHLCAAHMLHNLSRCLRDITQDKGKKRFILYCFALLQTTGDVENASRVFRAMHITFDSQLSTARVKRATEYLQHIINRKGLQEEVDETEDGDPLIQSHDEHPTLSLRESSPWFVHFKNVAESTTAEMQITDDETSCTSNDYYTPGLIDLLIKQFMHIYPLWSAVLLGDLQRYASDHPSLNNTINPNRVTNAIVENWFGNVKKDFCGGNRTRLRPGEFIRKAYTNVIGRVREVELRPTKQMRKKKKKTASKGRYFGAPTNGMPRPRASKKNDQVTGKKNDKKKRATREHSQAEDEEISCEKKGHPRKRKSKTPKKTSHKRKRKGDEEDTTNPEEHWRKKMKRKETFLPSPQGQDSMRSTPDVKTSNPATNKQKKESSLPRWGGNATYKGKTIKLGNTCTIDNFLVILTRLVQQYQKLRENLQQGSKTCREIVKVLDLCSDGQWNEGKVQWLFKICRIEVQVHDTQHVNAFGSEYDFFVRHMEHIQGNNQMSTCSNRECGRRIRNTYNGLIQLG